MAIEFLKEWRVYRAGQVTDAIPAGVADLLLKRGIARLVPAVEADLVSAEQENAREPDAGKAARRRK